jgi:K+-sensing histidine kinase KdpD
VARPEGRIIEPARRLAVRGLPPVPATLLGAAAVGLAGVLAALLDDSVGHAGQALLLVVPVTATAVLGGRVPALCAAALATLAFTLVLPPVGTLRVRFAEDAVALGVFTVVAFTIGSLVAHRIEALGWLERQRAALLRSVSHDLRTPLAAIRAAVSELEDDSLHDAAARRRLFVLVGDEAERLDRLVGNLLSLARVEGGGLRPHRQSVDLGELVDGALARLGHAIAGTEVVVTADPDLPPVLVDHTLFEQVVTNLVENAVRHSPPGAPVTVELTAGPRSVRLRVADQGPGVSPAEAATIFEPFSSGSAATSGVGLAICKAVVEAHDGTITVLGSSPSGAAFTVTLPRR